MNLCHLACPLLNLYPFYRLHRVIAAIALFQVQSDDGDDGEAAVHHCHFGRNPSSTLFCRHTTQKYLLAKTTKTNFCFVLSNVPNAASSPQCSTFKFFSFALFASQFSFFQMQHSPQPPPNQQIKAITMLLIKLVKSYYQSDRKSTMQSITAVRNR